MFQVTEGRWGSREVEITSVQLAGPDGNSAFVFHTGDAVSITLGVRAVAPTSDFIFGIGVFNADGVCCFGTNTGIEDMTSERIEGDATVTFTIDHMDLVDGTYQLDVVVY